MAEQYLLEIKNLTKVYGNGTEALKGVSFNVKKGEFLVVIGLSGSGKSTLLKCLNRLQLPTSGEVFFHQQNVSRIEGREKRALRTRMAMIFQHFNLIERYSVITNVLTGSLSRTGSFKSLLGLFSDEDRKRAEECLELVGLADKVNMRVDALSGGQQQRVAIARALMQEPEVLLADEPVASLDPATCHIVMDHLRKINRELGITVIANLHFLSIVREYADRVIALKDGEIVYAGSPSEITEEWFQRIYGEGAREVHVQ